MLVSWTLSEVSVNPVVVVGGVWSVGVCPVGGWLFVGGCGLIPPGGLG